MESQAQRPKEPMKSKTNILRLNPEGKNVNTADIPWKTIALTAALSSVVGYGAVELFKWFATRAKSKLPDTGSGAQQNPVPQLPGAVSPGMFQSPYSQMAAAQGFPAPFQNPMVLPQEDDEPPKWFLKFKQEHEQRLANIEQQTAHAHATHLSAVPNPGAGADDYEYDDGDYEDVG